MSQSSHPSSAAGLIDLVASQVLTLRGQRVLIAQQLAILYGVETKVLNQAVRRNPSRFPLDFMFQLTWDELDLVQSQTVLPNVDSSKPSRSQSVTLKRGQNMKYAPYAFTEQGIAMLSSVLRSPEAIAVNVEIMRAFVQLRSILAEHQSLKHQLQAMEEKYDHNFKVVFDALHQLIDSPTEKSLYEQTRIGFTAKPKAANKKANS